MMVIIELQKKNVIKINREWFLSYIHSSSLSFIHSLYLSPSFQKMPRLSSQMFCIQKVGVYKVLLQSFQIFYSISVNQVLSFTEFYFWGVCFFVQQKRSHLGLLALIFIIVFLYCQWKLLVLFLVIQAISSVI